MTGRHAIQPGRRQIRVSALQPEPGGSSWLPGSTRSGNSGGDEPVVLDMVAVQADDRWLDALAAGREPLDPLASALAGWRDELTIPLPVRLDTDRVATALARQRIGTARPVLGIAAAICFILLGSAAVGSRLAHPGDALWPITEVLWSDRVASAAAGETAKGAMNDARHALGNGDPTGASVALTGASAELPRVLPYDGHDVLQRDYDDLAARVSSSMSAGSGSDLPGSAAVDLVADVDPARPGDHSPSAGPGGAPARSFAAATGPASAGPGSSAPHGSIPVSVAAIRPTPSLAVPGGAVPDATPVATTAATPATSTPAEPPAGGTDPVAPTPPGPVGPAPTAAAPGTATAPAEPPATPPVTPPVTDPAGPGAPGTTPDTSTPVTPSIPDLPVEPVTSEPPVTTTDTPTTESTPTAVDPAVPVQTAADPEALDTAPIPTDDLTSGATG